MLVDGVLRAPENGPDEVVQGHSAKEGVVEFVIPDTTTDIGLQIAEFGEGAPTIPIPLKPTTGTPDEKKRKGEGALVLRIFSATLRD